MADRRLAAGNWVPPHSSPVRHGRDRVDNAVWDNAHLIAGGGGIGRAGDVQRGLVERAEQDVRQRLGGLGRNAAEFDAVVDEASGRGEVPSVET